MLNKKDQRAHRDSWRSLRQTGRHRVVSEEAKGRRWRGLLKVAGVLLGSAALGAAGLWFVGFSDRKGPSAVGLPRDEEGFEVLYFETDGVLTRQWLWEQLPFGKGVPLMEIDIVALDAALERVGQVRSATVRRVFPSALQVSLQERCPVLRIRVADQKGQTHEWLIAEDGEVFEGEGYPRATLERLPYLGGVHLKREGTRYVPLEGVPVVAHLLAEACERVPEFYKGWRVVLLDDFQGRSEVQWASIRVRTDNMGELIFRTNDFAQQLQRLRTLVANIPPDQLGRVERIDLTLHNKAAVRVSNQHFQ